MLFTRNMIVCRQARGPCLSVAGDYYGGEEADAKGIMTTEDMRHYFLSTKTDPISNKDTDLVIQYSMKFTKTPECGGAYIKLLKDTDTSKFDNESPYKYV